MCRQVSRWTWHKCEGMTAGLPYGGANRALKSAEAAWQVEGAVAWHPRAKVRLLLLNARVVFDAARDVSPGAVSLEVGEQGRDGRIGSAPGTAAHCCGPWHTLLCKCCPHRTHCSSRENLLEIESWRSL